MSEYRSRQQAAIRKRRAEVVRLRTVEGLKQPEIAERLGLTRATVTRDLHASGLRYHVPGAEERRARVVELKGRGYSEGEIAKRVGCSPGTVVRDCQIAGVPGPRPVRPTSRDGDMTCPNCGWAGRRDWAGIVERSMRVAVAALKLAAVEGADPVDVVMQAANVDQHADPKLVRNRARWLLQRDE